MSGTWNELVVENEYKSSEHVYILQIHFFLPRHPFVVLSSLSPLPPLFSMSTQQDSATPTDTDAATLFTPAQLELLREMIRNTDGRRDLSTEAVQSEDGQASGYSSGKQNLCDLIFCCMQPTVSVIWQIIILATPRVRGPGPGGQPGSMARLDRPAGHRVCVHTHWRYIYIYIADIRT